MSKNASVLIIFLFQISFFLTLFDSAAWADQDDTTVIEIKGAPLAAPVDKLPGSNSVVDQQTLQERGSSHMGEALELFPNLNFAGGTSRPRFFQIRGIGELEQYETAPNPSVGLYYDDIDLSGIGSVAPLFDIAQIEVLRGPQSVLFGANALAGVINLVSNDPVPASYGRLGLGAGTDEFASGNGVLSGAVPESNGKLLYRLGAFHQESNGFRNNLYLSRDDTNGRDESGAQLKLKWLSSAKSYLTVTGVLLDQNNGYDAFAIDNTFRTQSDRPGSDTQYTRGMALRFNTKEVEGFEIQNILSGSRSDSDYSYDGDWGNNPFWEPYAPYDYFASTDRSRRVFSDEIRVSSNDEHYTHGENFRFTTGLYAQRLGESSQIRNSSDGAIYDYLGSDYVAETYAAFGQVEAPLAQGTALNVGLRLEKRDSFYDDNRANEFSPSDSLWGGVLGVDREITESTNLYLLTSRGFKGGGFNVSLNTPDDKRQYNPENLINFETGIKSNWLKGDLRSNISIFHMLRRDQQIKYSLQADPTDPLTFIYITDNAAEGWNTGAEADLAWRAASFLSFGLSAGLLDSKFTSVPAENSYLLGREQSHAPNWQYALSGTANLTEAVFFRAELTGKDDFYFDDSNNEKSSPYHLVNLALGYKKNSWGVTLWGRNIFDMQYAVRGFFFENEPPDFPVKRYVQWGDRAQVGLNVSYQF